MSDKKQWIGQAEGFRLEAKSKKTPNTKDLEKDDVDGLARTICGFLNADGGTLVFGAITSKQDGLDIIEDLQHLEKCDALVSKIEASLSDWISPPPFGIKVSAETEGDCSHIVIDIPPSDDAPHQCGVARNHRFYRRTLQGTIIMDQRMIRDAFFQAKEASMSVALKLTGQPPSKLPHFRQYGQNFLIILENTSEIAVTAPFVTLEGSDAQRFRKGYHVNRPGIFEESYAFQKISFTTNADFLLSPYTHTVFAGAEITYGVPALTSPDNYSKMVVEWRHKPIDENHTGLKHVDLRAKLGGTNMPVKEVDLSKSLSELQALRFRP